MPDDLDVWQERDRMLARQQAEREAVEEGIRQQQAAEAAALNAEWAASAAGQPVGPNPVGGALDDIPLPDVAPDPVTEPTPLPDVAPPDPYDVVREQHARQQAAVAQQYTPTPDEAAYLRNLQTVQGARDVATSRTMTRSANPFYEEAQDLSRAVGEEGRADKAAAQQEIESSRLYEEEMAGIRTEQAMRAHIEQGEIEAKEQARSIARYEAEERVRETLSSLDAATKELSEARDFDVDEMWASKSGLQKVMLAIGAALVGFGGGNAMANINAVVDNEINAHKMKVGKLGAVVRGAQQKNIAAERMRAVVMGNIDDERVADEIIRAAFYDGIKTQIEAAHQRQGLRALTPAAMKLMADVETARAAAELKAKQLAVANPKAFVSSRPTYSKEARDMAKAEHAAGLKGVGAAEARMSKTAEAKKAAAQAAKKVDPKNLQEYQKRREPAESFIFKIRDFRRATGGDITGRWFGGISPNALSEAGRAQATQMDDILESDLRASSGAAVTPEEFERYKKRMFGQWGSEQDIWNYLDMRERQEAAKLDRAQRAFVGGEAETFERTENITRPEARGGVVAPSGALPSEQPR